MAIPLEKNYKLEYARYRHYFHRIWKYYEKPATKVSSALLLTIFTIIFFAAFAIRPTLTTIAELLRKIEDQSEVLDQMKRKSAALASAQQEYSISADSIEQLNNAIPDTYQTQELLNLIEGIAAHHQIAFDSFNLSELTYQADAKPSTPGVQTMSLSINIETDYPTLELFLADLTSLERVISVESVSFSEPSSADENSGIIKMSVNTLVYYLPLASSNNNQ